tara:strand:- start:57 stop:251 length:195 start_codon:yes stop_codon:yes gene_type:complete
LVLLVKLHQNAICACKFLLVNEAVAAKELLLLISIVDTVFVIVALAFRALKISLLTVVAAALQV